MSLLENTLKLNSFGQRMSIRAGLVLFLFAYSQSYAATSNTADSLLFAAAANTADKIVLSEVEAPIVINNASENITCSFIKGNRMSFQPFDELVIDFDAKTPIAFELRNEANLELYGLENSLNIFADSPEKTVKPEDCVELMARIRQHIDQNNQIVLNGKRRLLVAYKNNLVEEQSAELNLGEQLHGNGNEPLVVHLGRSVYIDMGRELPTSLSEFKSLVGEKTGQARLHPRAASDVGIHCVRDPNFSEEKFTLALGLYPSQVAHISKATAADSLSGLSKQECELKRQELFAASEKIDPRNNGEIVPVRESIAWSDVYKTLLVTLRFTYQNIDFKEGIAIDLQ